MSGKEASSGRYRVLDIPISTVNMKSSVSAVIERAKLGQASFVLVREVPSLMLATKKPKLKALHEKAFLVVPDGMPLVWIGRLLGLGASVGRVAGADLVDAVCAASIETGQSHYFFGGRPGVGAEMASRLSRRYPGLAVVGVYSPPVRHIDEEFWPDDEVVAELEHINACKPDFIWVGLSSPKQEYWMSVALERLHCGVMIGVGAAFDFHAGTIKRAPRWMQRSGLEWLHRLFSEPRRLWRRYLILAPKFVFANFWWWPRRDGGKK